ncbi:hypothetical protein BH09MYX1_BH09MYX1_00580 [soil metagenome]
MGSAFGTATKSLKFEPTIDVRAREDEMLFILDVPGVKQDDLDITLEHRLLTIKGVRSFERREASRSCSAEAMGLSLTPSSYRTTSTRAAFGRTLLMGS